MFGLRPKLQPPTRPPFDNCISEALHSTAHAALVLSRIFVKNSRNALKICKNTWLKFCVNPLYRFCQKDALFSARYTRLPLSLLTSKTSKINQDLLWFEKFPIKRFGNHTKNSTLSILILWYTQNSKIFSLSYSRYQTWGSETFLTSPQEVIFKCLFFEIQTVASIAFSETKGAAREFHRSDQDKNASTHVYFGCLRIHRMRRVYYCYLSRHFVRVLVTGGSFDGIRFCWILTLSSGPHPPTTHKNVPASSLFEEEILQSNTHDARSTVYLHLS